MTKTYKVKLEIVLVVEAKDELEAEEKAAMQVEGYLYTQDIEVVDVKEGR